MVEVFGEAGKHTRTAVGVAGLPQRFAGSVYIIVEVESEFDHKNKPCAPLIYLKFTNLCDTG